jgi:hypothetical protein
MGEDLVADYDIGYLLGVTDEQVPFTVNIVKDSNVSVCVKSCLHANRNRYSKFFSPPSLAIVRSSYNSDCIAFIIVGVNVKAELATTSKYYVRVKILKVGITILIPILCIYQYENRLLPYITCLYMSLVHIIL